MSVVDPERAVAHLAPLRQALLAAAAAEAAAAIGAAEEASARGLAQARAEAARMLAEASAEAAADAERLIARDRAGTRRHAQFLLMSARREVYDRLRARAHGAVLELATEDGYPQLLDRLERHARDLLGPGAVVRRDPAGVPGVLAEAGGRRVELTVTALADEALEQLSGRVEQLWR